MSDPPCAACPVFSWKYLTDPKNTETERAIRADQRALDMRELQATARDLAWLLDRVVPVGTQGKNVLISVDKLDQIRRHATRLVTLAERKQAA